jgi:hypothetical protein
MLRKIFGSEKEPVTRDHGNSFIRSFEVCTPVPKLLMKQIHDQH